MDMTFLRASVLATFLLLTACDSSTQPAKIDAPAATVLEGKTMGTFWRVSVRRSWMPTISYSLPIKMTQR